MMGAHSGRGVRSKEGLDASAISPPHKRDQIMFGQPHPLEFPRPDKPLCSQFGSVSISFTSVIFL